MSEHSGNGLFYVPPKFETAFSLGGKQQRCASVGNKLHSKTLPDFKKIIQLYVEGLISALPSFLCTHRELPNSASLNSYE